MKALVETNAYLRRPGTRRWMLQHNALESSIFEGASCLHAEKAAKVAVAAKAKVHVIRPKTRRRLSKASVKNSVKGS